MAIADYTDYVHTGPGTLGGRYLRLFWQPVYRAQDLAPGQAVPIRTMGEDFTLYRGEGGAPHVTAYRCAHRGTQLSVGWVEGDCIRCRYHGWMYDASGQCVEQPGEDPDFATRVGIRSYPTQEYLGLIFAYLGEGEPPEIRHYPDLERPGIFEVDPPEVWPCNFFNRQDNDPYHTVWTHRESSRRMGRPQQPKASDGVKFVETPYGMGCPTPGGSNSHFHMPNTHQLKVAVRVPGYEKLSEYRLCWHMPIDDEHCVAYDVNLVTGLSPEDGERFRQQRRAIQENDVTSPYEVAEAILAGKMRVEDMDPEFSYYKQFWIEDYVTQVGQGIIPDRDQERIGSTDSRTVLKRRLWQREMKALAEGRPLTEWTSPLMYHDD
jgi:5,5'-dehydrodivanillate O-demethylase